MLADHSPTQMGARWIDHDLTQFDGNILQVLIVTGGRTPDPNDSYSTMPIDTTELLLPAASSWVRRRRKVDRSKTFPSQIPGAALPRPLFGARAASLPLTLIVTGGQLDNDDDNDGEEDPTDQVEKFVYTHTF